jgi:hypothetical protein
MPVIRVETWIGAAIETCFDLARSVDAHVSSTAKARERVVAGVTSGLLTGLQGQRIPPSHEIVDRDC